MSDDELQTSEYPRHASAAPPPPSIRPSLAITFFALCLLVLVLIFFPQSTDVSETTKRRFKCLSNVKQLGTAVLIYAADSDGLPPPLERWETSLEFPKSLGVPSCPVGESQGLRHGYALNGLLGHQLPEDATLPMVLESKLRQVNATITVPDPPSRHDGKNNLCFADGHGKTLTDEQFRSLRLEPPPNSSSKGLK